MKENLEKQKAVSCHCLLKEFEFNSQDLSDFLSDKDCIRYHSSNN